MTRVKAEANYIRGSALKFRRITKLLRGKKVTDAMNYLKFMPHKSAKALYKLVKSAAANARNNYKMNEDSLFIDEIFADNAGMLKRFKARARGRGFAIVKRLSHITVYVAPKEAK